MTTPPAAAHAGLQVSDLVVRFGAVTALDGWTLRAQPGAVTAVLGPNGAGKTTLVRSCVGLVEPDRGDIRLLAQRPGSAGARARVGLMPQRTGSWSGVRAAELLHYLASLYQHSHHPETLMAAVGIRDFADTQYRRLSGGQQQLVNLAGALVGRPELVFLDEPTAGMDPHVRRHTWQVIQRLRDAGVAVILMTHDMSEATELADLVHLMDAGRVVLSGTVAELTRHGSLEQVFLDRTGREER